MIDILISILGLQIFFIILKGTKAGRLIYLLGKITKQMLILNCNILRLLLKKTKDINKKLKDKIYSKQNKQENIKHKKVANGDNIINFKGYKKKK
ncbi:TPA: hypothetical protein ACXDAY_002313 [Clostridium botulinum]|uniref:hypothetical protein n=2 Tax=Clostridium botulinum TaxID=1491 RepID=UPI00046586BD|nr:hypothetical protein [Clostridium botulinum]APH21043.1 hypothetical protein NPD1_4339 [Clostridium botulinum]APQ71135.1 hypothetical protein RSJ8_4296 [Clostridium botulinum]APR02388.1 hypothetical protein RSJ2_4157 [Clostridium botulinum]AUN01403.1 hypothetical protein RSJ19_00030 [Clostridium botulinum]MBN3351991.1 hypothetical protein [Clostridium botulinum]